LFWKGFKIIRFGFFTFTYDKEIGNQLSGLIPYILFGKSFLGCVINFYYTSHNPIN
jgi:hypothetical protein